MKTGTHTQVPVPMTIACPHDYLSRYCLAGLPLHNYAEAV